MIITRQVAFYPDNPDAVLARIRLFNTACNWLSKVAFEKKVFHSGPLHRLSYYETREKFGLTSRETLKVCQRVVDAYRVKDHRVTLATFRSTAGMLIERHRYKNGKISSCGLIKGRVVAHDGADLPVKPKCATLVYRNKRFYIHQPVEIDQPLTNEVGHYLGVDLGIVNIAVDSLGETFSGKALNGLRRRHNNLKSRLQAKGTKSAKRLLNKRRCKESRFSRNTNHVISKMLVAKAGGHSCGIALEDLKGIRSRLKVRKAQRRNHHSWSFSQLRLFITYKAALSGVPLVTVDPRNTSRTCPACKYISKANRVSRDKFACQSCGHVGPADYIAACNIASRADLGSGQTQGLHRLSESSLYGVA